MFKITLSPIAGTKDTQISASGSVLTIDGDEVDFSEIEEGGSAEGFDKIQGVIKNIDGVYFLTVLYNYNLETSELIQSANIDDYVVKLIKGEIKSPIIKREVIENNAGETENV